MLKQHRKHAHINNATSVQISFLMNFPKRVHVAVSVLSAFFLCLSSCLSLFLSVTSHVPPLLCSVLFFFFVFLFCLLLSLFYIPLWPIGLLTVITSIFQSAHLPHFSLSRPPPFTLSTLSEGAIQINASALKVTTCIQLQGLFLNESHPRPCLSPHQGANHHLISGLRHVFPWAKDILNASMQTWMLGQCIARTGSPCKYLMVVSKRMLVCDSSVALDFLSSLTSKMLLFFHLCLASIFHSW